MLLCCGPIHQENPAFVHWNRNLLNIAPGILEEGVSVFLVPRRMRMSGIFINSLEPTNADS